MQSRPFLDIFGFFLESPETRMVAGFFAPLPLFFPLLFSVTPPGGCRSTPPLSALSPQPWTPFRGRFRQLLAEPSGVDSFLPCPPIPAFRSEKRGGDSLFPRPYGFTSFAIGAETLENEGISVAESTINMFVF